MIDKTPPRPWLSDDFIVVTDADIISEAARLRGRDGQAARPLTSSRAKMLGIASGKARRKAAREKKNA